MLISRTPYRFSLYGGGLDYPGWYKKNNSRVLCAGLDYYCYQSVRELPPFFDHNYRICYSNIELAKNLDDINHPSAREVIRKFGEGKSLEVIPTAAQEVFDVSGAGDTVIAALAMCLSAGTPFIESARFANLAAGIVVGKVGTATVSPQEILSVAKR
mgnify:CR=1 FL=1